MVGVTARAAVVVFVVAGALAAAATPGPSAVRLPVTVIPAPQSSVVVEPGDHLWKISASHLRQQLHRDADDAEIWPYWREVIAANVAGLRSGDPDLIFPGEVIALPRR
jgi:nucleoid-associated protein YgaU